MKIVKNKAQCCGLFSLKYANSFHENPPNRISNRFFKLNSVEIRCSLNPKAQAVNKAQQQLGLFKLRAQIKYKYIFVWEINYVLILPQVQLYLSISHKNTYIQHKNTVKKIKLKSQDLHHSPSNPKPVKSNFKIIKKNDYDEDEDYYDNYNEDDDDDDDNEDNE